MAKHNLRTIGVNGGARPFRIAASATRYYAGEPVNFAGSYSSGVASVNTVVVATDGKPVIGTDVFVGIFAKDAPTLPATLAAHTTQVVVPIPYVTIIRGKAKTTTNVDTDSELLGVLWDVVLFDLTSTTYTIDETAAADTSGLTIVNGVPGKGLLDVTVDARAMRADIS